MTSLPQTSIQPHQSIQYMLHNKLFMNSKVKKFPSIPQADWLLSHISTFSMHGGLVCIYAYEM